jgi:hypothetical protein
MCIYPCKIVSTAFFYAKKKTQKTEDGSPGNAMLLIFDIEFIFDRTVTQYSNTIMAKSLH